MQLSQLLMLSSLEESLDVCIKHLALDSRLVCADTLFFACQGTQVHGERFITQAVQQGAVAVVRDSQDMTAIKIETLQIADKLVPCVSIPHLNQSIGDIAARFYGYPTEAMNVIGVTGTNGKTSITHFIAQFLEQRAPCGILGTVGYGRYGQLQTASHTTPDALRLQQWFAEFKQQEVLQIVMEVSSHALAQGRVNGTLFDTAVFSNLTRDHLDFHQTMEAYAAAKARLFQWHNLQTAVVNIDDAFGKQLFAELPTEVQAISYSLQNPHATLYGEIVAQTPQGMQLNLHYEQQQITVQLPLYGRFNASNVLAAVAVLVFNGFNLIELAQLLPQIKAVAGRMEIFRSQQQGLPVCIVDYAHTPDALEKTLTAITEHCHGKIWCVFGCGGDRDAGKRPLMGAIAKQLAHHVILTNDNPRHEDPMQIIQAILQAWQSDETLPHVMIDREKAIRYALQHAAVNDIVLVAGKGHEDYQQIGDKRISYSDRVVVGQIMA